MVINQLGVSPNLLRVPATFAQGGGAGPGSQDKGPNFSVNGRSQPIVDMQPGEAQMWRIANTSGRSGAYLRRDFARPAMEAAGAGRRPVRLRQLRQEHQQGRS